MGPSDGLVKYTSPVVYINTFKINTCPTYLFKYEFAGYGGFFPHYNNLLYKKGHNPQLFIKLITYKG